MSRHDTIDERVAALERDLAALKRQLRIPASDQNWLERVAGSFRNDPAFDEVLRLGREIRQADAPSESASDQP